MNKTQQTSQFDHNAFCSIVLRAPHNPLVSGFAGVSFMFVHLSSSGRRGKTKQKKKSEWLVLRYFLLNVKSRGSLEALTKLKEFVPGCLTYCSELNINMARKAKNVFQPRKGERTTWLLCSQPAGQIDLRHGDPSVSFHTRQTSEKILYCVAVHVCEKCQSNLHKLR